MSLANQSMPAMRGSAITYLEEYSFDVDIVAERDERRLAMARHAVANHRAVEHAVAANKVVVPLHL